jgi:cytochrome c556
MKETGYRCRMYLRIACTALATVLIGVPTGLTIAAAPANPLPLLKARHDHYHDLGEAFKIIRDQSRSTTMDPVAVQKAAQLISDASIDQGKWFPKGTGPEAGKTRALPEIWSKPEEFIAAQKLFSDTAPALLTAAKAGDRDGVRTAATQLAKACKNCHENFRDKDEQD